MINAHYNKDTKQHEITFSGMIWIEDEYLCAKERIEILTPANDGGKR